MKTKKQYAIDYITVDGRAIRKAVVTAVNEDRAWWQFRESRGCNYHRHVTMLNRLFYKITRRPTVVGLQVFLTSTDDKIVQEYMRDGTFPGTQMPMQNVARGAAVGYGIVVPVMVLILFTVAGTLWHRHKRGVSLLVGSAGMALLVLSLRHCTDSLMMFGLTEPMAFLFALGIDYGLVSLEIGKIFSRD